jgi:hypothetical protein
MKLTTKLIGLGAIGAGVAYWRKHAVRPLGPEENLPVAGQMTNTDLRDVATRSGIADVDPQPISHIAGEGIDLDGDIAAHDALTEVRERLP